MITTLLSFTSKGKLTVTVNVGNDSKSADLDMPADIVDVIRKRKELLRRLRPPKKKTEKKK